MVNANYAMLREDGGSFSLGPFFVQIGMRQYRQTLLSHEVSAGCEGVGRVGVGEVGDVAER
jgi:hypothetical protein